MTYEAENFEYDGDTYALVDAEALKLGDNTIGGASKPIYCDAGELKECDPMVAVADVRAYIDITLSSSNWSGSNDLYTQTIEVSGVTADSSFTATIVHPTGCTSSEKKAIDKAAAYIYEAESGDGVVTFTAIASPTVDLTIRIQGII